MYLCCLELLKNKHRLHGSHNRREEAQLQTVQAPVGRHNVSGLGSFQPLPIYVFAEFSVKPFHLSERNPENIVYYRRKTDERFGVDIGPLAPLPSQFLHRKVRGGKAAACDGRAPCNCGGRHRDDQLSGGVDSGGVCVVSC